MNAAYAFEFDSDDAYGSHDHGLAEPSSTMIDRAPVRVTMEPPLASDSLLRGRRFVQIEHNGALYQLRATKYGRLILTK